MKTLIRFLIALSTCYVARSAPNDAIITQANATTGTAYIQTVIPGTPGGRVGFNSVGKAFTYPASWVDITAYGAIADGATDIAPAVLAAIAAVPSGGGTIFFPQPAVSYMWKNQVVCNKSNITFLGFGANIVSDTAADCRKLSFTGLSGIVVSGLNFDGDFPVGSGIGNGFGFLEFTNCTNWMVTQCGFSNTKYDGVFAQGSNNGVSITNNRFSFYFGGAIFQSTGTTAQPIGINVSTNLFLAGNATTGTSGSGSVKIDGLGTATGSVNLSLEGKYTISGNLISNTASQMGIELNGSTNHASVVGNSIYGVGYGVSVANCNDVAVASNTLTYCQAYAVEIASAAANVTCAGNVIDGNNSSGSPAAASIGYSVVATNNTTITGGSVLNCGDDLYAQDASGVPVVGLNVTGVTFGPVPGNGEVYLKYAQNWNISGCTFNGGGSTYNYITIDNTDGGTNYGNISGNKFTGATSNGGFIIDNYGTNALQYLSVTDNDTTNTGALNGFWNEQGGFTNNLQYIRCHDNIDPGTSGNFTTAIELHSFSASANLVMATSRWYSLERSIISMSANAGPDTITLQSAVNLAGWECTIVKSDSSANPVTVATTGGQTINGASTYLIAAQYNSVKVRSDGANWQIAAANPGMVSAPVPLGNLTGTVNINWALGNTFYGTLTGNTTFTFSNAVAGQNITARVYQTGTNSFTVTWPTVSWTANTPPVMTTGAAAHDTTTLIYANGTYDGSSVQNLKP